MSHCHKILLWGLSRGESCRRCDASFADGFVSLQGSQDRRDHALNSRASAPRGVSSRICSCPTSENEDVPILTALVDVFYDPRLSPLPASLQLTFKIAAQIPCAMGACFTREQGIPTELDIYPGVPQLRVTKMTATKRICVNDCNGFLVSRCGFVCRVLRVFCEGITLPKPSRPFPKSCGNYASLCEIVNSCIVYGPACRLSV
ncbi:hypothetical protein DFH08DRAFT_848800 [Mycena albidolilacea]|uniref:Uncharacterized protein n=1 Tax=Mycena albidolilacea TaxID=1033008 RepID=A0AAD7AHI0_9AGAR|nr:hypothetical protein DFH08DRAFT_848800 [Mycena albidolilacea]